MADSRISTPGASPRAVHPKQQAEIEAAELLLGDSLYLGIDAVFGAILLSFAEIIRIPNGERTEEKVEAVILATARTLVHASALAVGRNVNLVRKGGHHG